MYSSLTELARSRGCSSISSTRTPTTPQNTVFESQCTIVRSSFDSTRVWAMCSCKNTLCLPRVLGITVLADAIQRYDGYIGHECI